MNLIFLKNLSKLRWGTVKRSYEIKVYKFIHSISDLFLEDFWLFALSEIDLFCLVNVRALAMKVLTKKWNRITCKRKLNEDFLI